MPQAADGSFHRSNTRVQMYEDSKPKAAAPAKEPMMKKPMQEGDANDVSHMDMKEVVAKHGPATGIEIMHDHEAGKHHVHSTHGKHSHESDHESAQDAHDHAAQAAGIDHDSEDEEDGGMTQTPDDQESEPAAIPGMK